MRRRQSTIFYGRPRSSRLLTGLALMLGLAACRSKVAAHVDKSDGSQEPATEDPAPAASEAPSPAMPAPAASTELEHGLDETRLYYQTRNTITLQLSHEVLPPGSTFSLVNATTRQALVEDEAVSLPLALDDLPFALTQGSGYDVILKLYPGTEAMSGRFAYGENVLDLLISDGATSRHSSTSIHLCDFDLLAPGTVAAAAASVAAGPTLELWMNPTSRPTVSRGTQLTVGASNILSD